MARYCPQYSHELGLRGVSKDMCEADLSKLELFGNQEIVLVYTDSAREYIETENGKKWRDKTLAGFPTKEGAYNIVQILREENTIGEVRWNM